MWSILVDILNPYEATMEMIRKGQGRNDTLQEALPKKTE